jgi:hypothetical protein
MRIRWLGFPHLALKNEFGELQFILLERVLDLFSRGFNHALTVQTYNPSIDIECQHKDSPRNYRPKKYGSRFTERFHEVSSKLCDAVGSDQRLPNEFLDSPR